MLIVLNFGLSIYIYFFNNLTSKKCVSYCMVTYLTTVNKYSFLTYRMLFKILISVEIRHCFSHLIWHCGYFKIHELLIRIITWRRKLRYY